jgi:flagellar biogenesis protein FliO
MDALWRLTWALPVVLLTGIAVMFVLKRWVTPERRPGGRTAKAVMSLRESLSVSDQTHVYLIAIGRQEYVLVESARNTVMQARDAVSLPRRIRPW